MEIATFKERKATMEAELCGQIQRTITAFEMETGTTVTGVSVSLDNFIVKHGNATTSVTDVDVTALL